jgi:hypothetical protein
MHHIRIFIIMNLNEELQRIKEIMSIDEMAYPVDFNFEEFRNIKSFAGRLAYAKKMLMGKVGAGSGRAVFRIDDEKVLKVAMNQKGVAQNEAESDWGAQQYDVVAKVFESDREDTWIEMEIAKKVSPSRFSQLTGTNPDELGKWLENKKDRNDGRTPRWSNLPDLNENEFAVGLLRFVLDYGYPVSGDFGVISSYGEVIRDGQPRIVVIDFGYNSSTKEVYQIAREKSAQRHDQHQRRYW